MPVAVTAAELQACIPLEPYYSTSSDETGNTTTHNGTFAAGDGTPASIAAEQTPSGEGGGGAVEAAVTPTAAPVPDAGGDGGGGGGGMDSKQKRDLALGLGLGVGLPCLLVLIAGKAAKAP